MVEIANFIIYRGPSSHRNAPCLAVLCPLPGKGMCRYIGQGVGVDCLFCSKALASRDHDKLNIVPRLLFVYVNVRKERAGVCGTMLHIGKHIKEIFNRQPKSCTVQWFAAQLHCDRRNIYRIFEKDNIDIQLLARISAALHHDFFADLSSEQQSLCLKWSQPVSICGTQESE